MSPDARPPTYAQQTRQKLKEAYEAEFAATIERAEKQIILAKHGRRLLQLLDDTPVVPGDMRPPYQNAAQARQILNDAEDDLRDWQPEQDDFSAPAMTENSEMTPPRSSAKGKEKFADETTVVSPSVHSEAKGKEKDIASLSSAGPKEHEVLQLT
jgi:Eisosome component PIL1